MTTNGARDEQALVDDALASLREQFPDPTLADPVLFLGAQFDHGLAWVQFDAGFGGLGASVGLQPGVARRLADLGAPATLGDFVAVHQVAATIHALGNDEHKQRFLRRIFTGEDHWCQLFSEPAAGSDLAGVATIAHRDGDDWIATGQKVWTSGAREAAFALLLTRTEPHLPKHRGLTMFILDMTEPGLDVRPLRQADGGARFNEVFLTDVRVRESLRLGAVGDGWAVSLRVLQTERQGASDVFLRPIEELLEIWDRRKCAAAPTLRDQVVRMWMEAKLIDLNERRRRAAPDSVDAARLAAIAKVASSEHAQRLSGVLASVIGPAAVVDLDYASAYSSDLAGSTSSANKFRDMPIPSFVVRTRAMSIEGGTNEIQRNIIGERILGLPPDIRVDKVRPWIEVANG